MIPLKLIQLIHISYFICRSSTISSLIVNIVVYSLNNLFFINVVNVIVYVVVIYKSNTMYMSLVTYMLKHYLLLLLSLQTI